jgi:N4-gp56 family major capsid protein
MFNFIMDFTMQGMKDRAMVKQAEHRDFGGVGSSPILFFVDTSFAFSDPRAQTIWSDAVYEYGLENMFFTPFLGSKKDKNALIVMDSSLETKKGGTIIFEARNILEGGGQGDDGNTTGNEQQIKRRNMSMTIHQRQTSTVSAGAMSEQLTKTEFREDSRVELGTWVGEIMENDLVTSMAGLYNENSGGSAIQTVNESYPSDDRIYYGGQAADGTLGNSGVSYGTDALLTAGTQASNLMGTNIMESIKRRMISAIPRMRPVTLHDLSKANPDDVRSKKFSGPVLANVFVVLMHPLQIKAIRAETGETGWKTMQRDAQIRGNLNPIFTGAEFYHDGMLVFEYDRIPIRTGAGGTTLAEGFLLNAGRTATTDACASGRSVARAIFMGGQAAAFGWAMKPSWSEDVVDNDVPKIKVNMLYGTKKSRFNAHGTETPGSDESVFVLDTEVIVDA